MDRISVRTVIRAALLSTALMLAAAPVAALATESSAPISDGAAKGQANELTVQAGDSSGPPASGAPGAYVRRKLPGRMKSGTLSVAPNSGGAATSSTNSGAR